MRFHRGKQRRHCDIRRGRIDERRRRIHHVAGREQHLAAVAFHHATLGIGSRMATGVLKPLGEVVRLDQAKIPESCRFIVNDDVELALACDADGIHVGQGDLPCAEVRRRVGTEMLIGVSVSTVAEAMQAERDGADYLGVSPVFATPTKPDAPAAAGLDGLRAIRAAVRLPLVAIGGIHAGNAAEVLAAGADGLAVVSAIMSAADPCAAAQALRAAMRIGN